MLARPSRSRTWICSGFAGGCWAAWCLIARSRTLSNSSGTTGGWNGDQISECLCEDGENHKPSAQQWAPRTYVDSASAKRHRYSHQLVCQRPTRPHPIDQPFGLRRRFQRRGFLTSQPGSQFAEVCSERRKIEY